MILVYMIVFLVWCNLMCFMLMPIRSGRIQLFVYEHHQTLDNQDPFDILAQRCLKYYELILMQKIEEVSIWILW